jgi:hypothetical protein
MAPQALKPLSPLQAKPDESIYLIQTSATVGQYTQALCLRAKAGREARSNVLQSLASIALYLMLPT